MIFRVFSVFIFCHCLILSSIDAQPGIYSEDEIQVEDKFLKAKTQFILGKYDEAEKGYLEVFKKDIQNHAVAYELSRVYSKKKDNDNFEKYIKKAIKLSANNVWYIRTYTHFLEEEKRYRDALVHLDKLVIIEPRNESYLNKHADVATKALQYEKALKSYNMLQQSTGIQEDISRRKFELYVASGKKDQAIEELIALSNAYPKETRYLHNLASYYTEMGKKKDAKKMYQKVLMIDPNDPAANMAMSGGADLKTDAGYLQSIAGLLSKKDIDIDKKIIELIPYVSKIDKLDELATKNLLSNLDILEETHVEDPKVYSIYGDALMGIEDYEMAVSKYKSSLRYTKKVFPVWEQLMYALLEIKDYTELAQTADEALNYYPNQPICYFFLANGIGLQIEPTMDKEDLFMRGMTEAEWKKTRKPLYEESMDNFQEAILMTGRKKELKYKISSAAAQVAFNYGDFKKASNYVNMALDQGLKIKNPQLETLLKDIEGRLN